MAIIGFSALTMAWLPDWLIGKSVSYPVIFLVFGMILYLLPLNLPVPDIHKDDKIIVKLTELVVIITLMGTGLKINRPFNLKFWNAPIRLLIITMVICIAGLAFFAWWWVGLSVAAAVLLAASLAPTDPVLAGNVQVGAPSVEREDPVRFSLTAEAGMNDGMAFPFTWLAVVIATAAGSTMQWLTEWFLRDFLYRIIAGAGAGFLLGYGVAYLVFTISRKENFPKINDGFVALSTTLLVYGVTELISGYGFIAVFVAAVTMRNFEMHHKLHKELHDFIDQIEKILLVVLLIPFGGALVNGLLDKLTWMGVLVSLVFLFVIRPLAGLIALNGKKYSLGDKLAISFFGIRGIGSFFYLSFGLHETVFPEHDELWSIAGFIVLVSIVMHGVTASPVMNYLDKKRGDKTEKEKDKEEEAKNHDEEEEQMTAK